jgi:predicted transcriptional regulator YdeE
METFHLENNIKLLCITADSFPEGVLAAHQKLHSIIPHSNDRGYFGISYANAAHAILYKAAAEMQHNEEAEKWNLETFVIKKGDYISTIINNYRNDIPAIGKTFNQMLKDPRIDPNGACVEWYLNDNDVRCMVRIVNNEM